MKLLDALLGIDTTKLHIKLTWRLALYLFYIIITSLLVVRAIYYKYEFTPIAVLVMFLYFMSFPFSIFLIEWNGGDEDGIVWDKEN